MVFPGQQQRKAANKHSLYRSTRSDKQALTHMGKSSPVDALQLYYRSSQAPSLQLYGFETRRICTMCLSLTCSSGWLMASTHLVCTWTSYNHSADEPLNTRTQGLKCSHLQRRYLFSPQDSSNQIILLVSIQQVIFSNVVFGCTTKQIEREKVWKDFLKIKTTATYSSFLPFPSPPVAHFWSYTSF